MPDYYKVLQIDSNAEPEVIEAAYRELSRKYQWETNHFIDAQERMRQINAAYEILHDPFKRAEYDERRRGVAWDAERAARETNLNRQSGLPESQTASAAALLVSVNPLQFEAASATARRWNANSTWRRLHDEYGGTFEVGVAALVGMLLGFGLLLYFWLAG